MLIVKAKNFSPMLKEQILDELFDPGIKRRVAEWLFDGKKEQLMGSEIPDDLLAEFPGNFFLSRRSSFQSLVNEVINTAKEFLEDEDNIAVLASENGTEAKNVREICRMLLK